jgi:hypothetical protein
MFVAVETEILDMHMRRGVRASVSTTRVYIYIYIYIYSQEQPNISLFAQALMSVSTTCETMVWAPWRTGRNYLNARPIRLNARLHWSLHGKLQRIRILALQIYRTCKYIEHANISNMQIYRTCKYIEHASKHESAIAINQYVSTTIILKSNQSMRMKERNNPCCHIRRSPSAGSYAAKSASLAAYRNAKEWTQVGV